MSGDVPETIYCRKCKSTISIPHHVPREVSQITVDDTLALMQALQQHVGLDVRESKRLAIHVPRNGKCHKCGGPVPDQALFVCDCRSVNINLALLP